MEEVKQKMAEALKGIKIDGLQNCFEQWKNISIGVLYQMESTLKVTEIEHVKYTFFFINKFQFFGSPPYKYIRNHINNFKGFMASRLEP